MAKINHLEPKDIWANFEKLCAIPHPSKKEKKMVEFMVAIEKRNQGCGIH